MKKILIFMCLLIIVLFVSCYQEIEYDGLQKSNYEDVIENKGLSVEIESDKDYFSRMDYLHPAMTFTPILKGETDKDIQYHWIIENDVDFEAFTTLENGPTKDIINSGEPVGLGIYAEVSYAEGAVMEFSVVLQVEEKGTANILAKDELIIENREGEYRIKK